MTRSQFFIVLYKKLLLPVFIILAVWAAWLGVGFIIDTVTSFKGSSFNLGGLFWFILSMAAYIILLVLLAVALNKLTRYISAKTGIDIGKDSKFMKIFGRITDILMGMFIAYLWQQDKTKAFTVFLIYFLNFIREEFPKADEVKE